MEKAALLLKRQPATQSLYKENHLLAYPQLAFKFLALYAIDENICSKGDPVANYTSYIIHADYIPARFTSTVVAMLVQSAPQN